MVKASLKEVWLIKVNFGKVTGVRLAVTENKPVANPLMFIRNQKKKSLSEEFVQDTLQRCAFPHTLHHNGHIYGFYDEAELQAAQEFIRKQDYTRRLLIKGVTI